MRCGTPTRVRLPCCRRGTIDVSGGPGEGIIGNNGGNGGHAGPGGGGGGGRVLILTADGTLASGNLDDNVNVSGGAGGGQPGVKELGIGIFNFNQPPVAQCQNVTVSAGANCSTNASIDNGSFDPDGSTVNITQSPAGPYPLGSTTVTLTVTDEQGASSSCQAVVTVVDDDPPQITCPGPLTVQCDADVPAPNINSVTASDNCGSVTVTHVSDVPSGTCPKTITRTYKATDGSGNMSTCTQIITVNDTILPTITCPPNQTVPAGAGCVATVSVGTATATDNCPASPTVMGTRSDGLALNAPYPLGVTTITWTATDACGNMSTCTQTITVTNAAPTASAGAHQTVDEGAVVTLTGSASDPNPGQTISYQWVQVSGPPVTLTNATLPVVTFDAPEVPDLECVALVFQFRATDDCAATSADTVAIVVRDTLVLAGSGRCVVIRPNCTLSRGTYCWRSADGSVFRGPVRITVQSNGVVNLVSGPGDANSFQATVNLTTRRGQAQFQTPRTNPTRTETIMDMNTDDSLCNCT